MARVWGVSWLGGERGAVEEGAVEGRMEVELVEVRDEGRGEERIRSQYVARPFHSQ